MQHAWISAKQNSTNTSEGCPFGIFMTKLQVLMINHQPWTTYTGLSTVTSKSLEVGTHISVENHMPKIPECGISISANNHFYSQEPVHLPSNKKKPDKKCVSMQLFYARFRGIVQKTHIKNIAIPTLRVHALGFTRA